MPRENMETVSGAEPDGEAVKKKLATHTSHLIEQILPHLKIFDWEVSDERVKEVAFYVLRDIDRLDKQQRQSIAVIKFAAYWAFWVRKLKPVHSALENVELGGETLVQEATDVNERLAIEIAIAYVASLLPAARRQDGIDCLGCDGTKCFGGFVTKYFSTLDKYHYKYIVYSLGKRTFGPHHLSALLDLLVFGSCKKNADTI